MTTDRAGNKHTPAGAGKASGQFDGRERAGANVTLGTSERSTADIAEDLEAAQALLADHQDSFTTIKAQMQVQETARNDAHLAVKKLQNEMNRVRRYELADELSAMADETLAHIEVVRTAMGAAIDAVDRWDPTPEQMAAIRDARLGSAGNKVKLENAKFKLMFVFGDEPCDAIGKTDAVLEDLRRARTANRHIVEYVEAIRDTPEQTGRFVGAIHDLRNDRGHQAALPCLGCGSLRSDSFGDISMWCPNCD